MSSYLRRDIGIWACITSVAHVVVGFLVKHGDGAILSYFFEPGDRSRILTNSFGLANWAGLVAVVIVVGGQTVGVRLSRRPRQLVEVEP